MPDPGAFTAWGILGILAFAIAVLCGILWNLFNRQARMFETRDKLLMDFVDNHRRENAVAMDNVATKVSASHDNLATTLSHSLEDIRNVIDRHTRRLNDFMLTREVLSKVDQMKKRGDPLDETVVEKVIRTVINEQQKRE